MRVCVHGIARPFGCLYVVYRMAFYGVWMLVRGVLVFYPLAFGLPATVPCYAFGLGIARLRDSRQTKKASPDLYPCNVVFQHACILFYGARLHPKWWKAANEH